MTSQPPTSRNHATKRSVERTPRGLTPIEPPAARKGFTLIELLVVIAIISLLVSILLPSLQKAKSLAMQVVCLSRMRSISSALSIYQGDFDGCGPVGFTYGNNRSWSWLSGERSGIFVTEDNPYPKISHRYFGWFAKRTTENTGYDRNGNPCWALGEYLDRKGDYVQADGGIAKSPVACPIGSDSSLEGTRAGYSVNYWLGYDTFLGDYVDAPADSPMLMDGNAEGVPNNWARFLYPRNFGSSWSNFGDNFRLCSENAHDGSANYLFFDGHAENHIAPKMYGVDDIEGYLLYYRELWSWRGH